MTKSSDWRYESKKYSVSEYRKWATGLDVRMAEVAPPGEMTNGKLLLPLVEDAIKEYRENILSKRDHFDDYNYKNDHYYYDDDEPSGLFWGLFSGGWRKNSKSISIILFEFRLETQKFELSDVENPQIFIFTSKF